MFSWNYRLIWSVNMKLIGLFHDLIEDAFQSNGLQSSNQNWECFRKTFIYTYDIFDRSHRFDETISYQFYISIGKMSMISLTVIFSVETCVYIEIELKVSMRWFVAIPSSKHKLKRFCRNWCAFDMNSGIFRWLAAKKQTD